MSHLLESSGLIRLLQLSSPSLPIGAYSYSQGLETAVETGWVYNEESFSAWMEQQLKGSVERIDLPILVRLYNLTDSQSQSSLLDGSLQLYWSRYLLATRETNELVIDECQRGAAFARLLRDLGFDEAAAWADRSDTPFVTMFAYAAARWDIPLKAALEGYAWSWLENQVLAGMKLVPLGQVAGQRLLLELSKLIPASCEAALLYSDDDIGGTTPIVAIASSLHETQYTRLFRS